MRKLFFHTLLMFFITFNSYGESNINIGEKPCSTCDFILIEKDTSKPECKLYLKYFFDNMKIAKSYEHFGRYFVSNHKYAEFLKRFLPEESEKYIVLKEHTGNDNVQIEYEIIPRQKHIKEHKKANLTFQVNNEKYYIQLNEVDNGTEISSCKKITNN